MHHATILTTLLALGGTGCGDDTSGAGGGSGGGSSEATTAASTTASTTATSSTTSATTATTATSSTGGAGGAPGSGAGGDGGAGGDAPVVCTQAREDALGAIEEVSAGEVLVLDEADGEATIWIDATAGGIADQASNPWIYVDLATLSRVDVDDVQADSDASWDIALKRPIIRSNNHDGGLAGSGESAFLAAAFDDVTPEDVAGANFGEEHWFDAECNLLTDPTGAIATSFDGWYLYEDMVVTPAPGTWLVRGGSGDDVFKFAILDYYANDDGTTGQAGGRYLVRVAPLEP